MGVSERLGPVPADLQAWAKRASVVTTVGRKREARKKSRSRSPVTRKRSASRDKERGKDKETSRWETKGSTDLRRRGKRSPSPTSRGKRSPSQLREAGGAHPKRNKQ